MIHRIPLQMLEAQRQKVYRHSDVQGFGRRMDLRIYKSSNSLVFRKPLREVALPDVESRRFLFKVIRDPPSMLGKHSC